MALLMHPNVFSLYNFYLLLTVFSVKRESLPLTLGSKVPETPRHRATVATLFSLVTEMLYLVLHTAIHLCFPTRTFSAGTRSSRCSSCLNSTVQTGYQEGLLLFDFVFILAKALDLMFVTLKQL